MKTLLRQTTSLPPPGRQFDAHRLIVDGLAVDEAIGGGPLGDAAIIRFDNEDVAIRSHASIGGGIEFRVMRQRSFMSGPSETIRLAR